MGTIDIKGSKVLYQSAGSLAGGNQASQGDEKSQQQAPTRWVEFNYLHADGTGVANASYVLKSCLTGSILSQGTLDDKGFRRVDGLPSHEVAIAYWFHDDPKAFEIKRKPTAPPASQGFMLQRQVEEQLRQLGNGLSAAGQWSWGVLQGGFNKDASVPQIIADTVISLIPVVDQVADVRDLVANIFDLLQFYSHQGPGQKDEEEFWLWVMLVLTLIGCIPELGSAIKGVCRVILRYFRNAVGQVNLRQVLDSLLSVLNSVGKGNAFRWLKALRDQFDQHSRWAGAKLIEVLNAIEASLRKLPDLVRDVRTRFLTLLQKMKSRATAMVRRVSDWFKDKLNRILDQPSTQPRQGTTNARNTTQQTSQQPPASNGGSGPPAPRVERTTPSGKPDPNARPSGRRTPISPDDDTATRRSLTRENESADILAQKGYKVEQNPQVPGDRNPDFKIEGKVFDNYAPSTSNPRNIWSEISNSKVNPVGKPQQADRIVLNLRDSNVDMAALTKQFKDWPMPKLKEVLVIAKDGSVVPFWP